MTASIVDLQEYLVGATNVALSFGVNDFVANTGYQVTLTKQICEALSAHAQWSQVL